MQQHFEPPDLAAISSKTFRMFLLHHQLSYVKVARAANIHAVSVYNIASGVPDLSQHEAAVRAALLQLTGEHYTAFIHNVQPVKKHGL